MSQVISYHSFLESVVEGSGFQNCSWCLDEILRAISGVNTLRWREVTEPTEPAAATGEGSHPEFPDNSANELATLRAKLAATEAERDHAVALVTKHGQENIRLRAELVEALRVSEARLRSIHGLEARLNPEVM